MDDFNLTQTLNTLLSDPETGNKIQSLIQSLGGSDSDKSNTENSEKKPPDVSFPDINKLLKLKSLYESATSESDPHITLLSSLRPYLSDNRTKNLDSMMKLMKIYKIFNKVKDAELLKELF